MKRQFIDYTPQKATAELICVINKVVSRYADAGHDLTLRQLYYQLVSVNAIANKESSYKRLSEVVNKGRMAGLIDWNMIVDRGRETQQRVMWDSPEEILQSCVQSYGESLWAAQPYHLELIIEKQALQGVLWPVCLELDLPMTAIKGYPSASLLYDIAGRIADKSENGKQIVVLYMGDHDPSGQDIPRDVHRRLCLLSGIQDIHLQRLGLNADQVKHYSLIPQPTKRSDTPAAGFIAKHGTDSFELDALQPDVLEELVRDAVLFYRDEVLWAQSVEAQEANRAALAAMAGGGRK